MTSSSARAASLLLVSLLLPLPASALDTASSALGADYFAEFDESARKLRVLAAAIPGEKYSWRPADGVRSVAEVLQHLARGNFTLAEKAGVARPADLPPILEAQASKEEVTLWLERALSHGRSAAAAATAADLGREVEFFGDRRSVGGLYLRMLVHMNEHLGQLIAYARSVGIVPPWSQ